MTAAQLQISSDMSSILIEGSNFALAASFFGSVHALFDVKMDSSKLRVNGNLR
jgi:hypothetical protein